MTDKLFPVLLQGSRYADRLPIGKTEIIQNVQARPADALLQGLVPARSDGRRRGRRLRQRRGRDPGQERTSASIPATASPRPRPVYDVPDHAGTIYAIITDKEMTDTSVEIDNLLKSREQGSVEVYRQKTVDRLFSSHAQRAVRRKSRRSRTRRS